MIELLLQAERAMSAGLIDRAETLYEQVSSADPQNSIAVVGLARVALEHGDEPGALALARRALTIDPENAAASRMAERLEDLLRHREAEVPGVAGTLTTPPDEPVLATPTPTPTPTPARRRRSLLDRLLRRR